jgi:RHS repeat-associated protein
MVTQAIAGGADAEHQYNGVNTRVATGQLGKAPNNVFARDGVGVTAPVMRDSNAAYTPGTSERRSGVSTFSQSGIKNANVQTSSAGTVAATRTYDAFGNTVASTGTWKGPFGYAGQFGYQEDASGLKLLGNRYYDAEIGRFITKDPIKDGRNWYAYCNNNPITSYDADGLTPNSAQYNSQDEAAKAAGKYLNSGFRQHALDAGYEYGGVIYYDPKTGKYGYTFVTGDKFAVSTGQAPEGTHHIGTWHTQPPAGIATGTGAGGGGKTGDPKIPSPEDLQGFHNSPGFDYIITPDGKVWRWRLDHETGKETENRFPSLPGSPEFHAGTEHGRKYKRGAFRGPELVR